MRKKALPSLVVCILTAAAMSLTFFGEADRTPLVFTLKIAAIVNLMALGVSLAQDSKAT